MTVNITGNPGTDNTFVEINIRHSGNCTPTTIAVTINYYGSRAREPEVSSCHCLVDNLVHSLPGKVSPDDVISCLIQYFEQYFGK